MLKTSLGTIEILINGQKRAYKSTKLKNKGKQFSVDGRYKLTVDIPLDCDDIVVECVLADYADNDSRNGRDSGERLALTSFYHENTKLSIGAEDEIPYTYCDYADCGLRIKISKQAGLRRLIFGIAWIKMQDIAKEDIYTWFAADPTLYTSYEIQPIISI